MNIYCLINPVSGGKHGRQVLQHLRELAARGEFEGAVEESDPRNLARQLDTARRFDCLLLGGGDGTVSHVVQAWQEDDPPLAVLPLGTANDLAREFGIRRALGPASLKEKLLMLSEASQRLLSVWQVESGEQSSHSFRFCNYFSLGYDAAVVQRVAELRAARASTTQLCARTRTRFAYVTAGLRLLTTSAPIDSRLTSDAGTRYSYTRLRSLFVANVRTVMGLGWSNVSGSALDAELEVVPIASIGAYAGMLVPPSWRFAGAAPTGKEWVIELNSAVPVQADGEGMPSVCSGSFRISLSHRVRILS